MVEKLKLKISPAVAAYVRPAVSTAEKLRGLEAAAEMVPADQLMLFFCLMRDADDLIKAAATVAFGALPEKLLAEYIRESKTHPAILDAIARHHHTWPDVVAALLENEALSPQAAGFLKRFTTLDEQRLDTNTGESADQGCDEERLVEELSADDEEPLKDTDDSDEDEPGEVEEQDEEFLSKYKMAQIMGIAEKIKMALSGDKEWRSILIKDANKLVSGSVIKNPRITEAEIHTLVKAGVQNDEIMRLICSNKEWIKNYKIRKALVENPRTPVQNALRYLATLGEKDIASYAKSKNISSVISTQAKRMLLSKKR
ncbi:MAG: hypothetical protein A2X79_02755 [Desulfuromonadaceae bacterium GWB2_53_15]|nr:MAG: hypothetical protein A2X79_02755 [Desulfuromonadaceae bacterium GWB2_53_15]